MRDCLIVIPTYLRTPEDMDTTIEAVKSVRDTSANSRVAIQLVDDGSPEPDLVDKLEETVVEEYAADVHRKGENTGFSRTVNIGLQRALDEEKDAVLLNADVEITTKGWIGRFNRTLDTKGRPAAVVGALLLYPHGGLIQHAGIFFSLLTRTFDHRFKYGPANLPAALKIARCPVTGAFQYIRHETLTVVGLYDENFLMGWEDVDYCLRVFQAELECIYNPNVRAWHFEQMFRGRPSPKVEEWQNKSLMYLALKHRETNFAEIVPSL